MFAMQSQPEVCVQVETAPVTQPDPNACPKCGRIVKQGKFMHQKHCKGVK